jgi:hypothetical protein
MIVVYGRSFIVLANDIAIVNYDRKVFIVQATGWKGLLGANKCSSLFGLIVPNNEKMFYNMTLGPLCPNMKETIKIAQYKETEDIRFRCIFFLCPLSSRQITWYVCS